MALCKLTKYVAVVHSFGITKINKICSDRTFIWHYINSVKVGEIRLGTNRRTILVLREIELWMPKLESINISSYMTEQCSCYYFKKRFVTLFRIFVIITVNGKVEEAEVVGATTEASQRQQYTLPQSIPCQHNQCGATNIKSKVRSFCWILESRQDCYLGKELSSTMHI